jgi:glyoxylase-like metal-dependent hydrolase (beta-lactamase superfamily II)
VQAFLVEHAQGVLLVDTGFSSRQEEAILRYKGRHPAEEALLPALRKLGVAPGDIRTVINTHFHFDHCGGNYLLPAATFFIQRALLADRPDYVPDSFELLDGDTVVAPGVQALATPGHRPGHQSVVVETDRGPVVLTGDAVYTRRAYQTDELQARAHDPDAYRHSLQRLKAVDPYLVLFAHDPRPAGRGAK